MNLLYSFIISKILVYMPVPTKYPWNFSFQKKCSSKYVVKNARNVTQFVRQPFSIEFQGFVKNFFFKYIQLAISNVNNLCHQEAWNWGGIFKRTNDHIFEKTLKIELSPIHQAYTLKVELTCFYWYTFVVWSSACDLNDRKLKMTAIDIIQG
jgi:hypothetical protein